MTADPASAPPAGVPTAPAAGFRLPRPAGAGGRAFAIAPLVDVLLILLVFFLVTSTWAQLDMIPMAERGERPLETAAPPEAAPEPTPAAQRPRTLLLRLAPDGTARLRGRPLDRPALAAALAEAGAETLLILPSPLAPAQALVDALGAAAEAGLARVQVVRIAAEDAP